MSNSKSNNGKPQTNKNGETKPLERAVRDHKGIKQFKPDSNSADDSEMKLRSQDSVDADEENGKKKKREKKYRMRRFPIILRVVIVLALIVGAAILGAMIGYGIVGEGGDFRDVLDPETWWYIHDIIFSDTEFERER